jgi:UDP:flavonoid glycosyltransferase YjiC (YdhE family)
LKRILVAPLNWGLGHASRCVPLIAALQRRGAQVFLASDGAALRLLRAEFPELPSYRLPSYRIRYRTSNMVRNLAPQLPRMLWAIRSEQWATRHLVRKLRLDGIISDNRYGCFCGDVPAVLLTHQLYLRVPGALLEWSANQVLRMALAKFDQVWVPDVAGEPNLSGALSHGELAVHPGVRFSGIMTRLRHYEREQEYDVAVVLSGPEPQRTLLEQRLLEQAMTLPQKFIFIQGNTRSKQHYYAADHIEVVSYLTSRELNDVLAASRAVVCRSGYSSIMDLAALGKPALLVPTPGQTEQEYLAARLAASGHFAVQTQEQLQLERGLQQLAGTTGLEVGTYPTDDFEQQLEEWLDGLK